jgi:hypothetical protein
MSNFSIFCAITFVAVYDMPGIAPTMVGRCVPGLPNRRDRDVCLMLARDRVEPEEGSVIIGHEDLTGRLVEDERVRLVQRAPAGADLLEPEPEPGRPGRRWGRRHAPELGASP